MMSIQERIVCLGILDFLKEKHAQLYHFFAGPALAVLPPSLQNRYQELIHRPRDLEMIRLKINQGVYFDLSEFADDVFLCFENAKLFCSSYKEFRGVHDAAAALSKHFQKRLESEIRSVASSSQAQAQNKQQRPRKSVGAAGNSGGSNSGNNSRSSSPSLGFAGGREAAPQPPSRHARTEIFEMQSSLAERVVKPLKAEPSAAILLHPLSPSVEFYSLYCARIRDPMDIGTLLAKLEPAPRLSNSAKEKIAKSQGGSAEASAGPPKPYTFLDEFCADARKIFANAIRYNFHADKGSVSVRRNVTSMAVKFEQRLLDWNKKQAPGVPLCPPMPEMRICLAALEAAFKVDTCIREAPAGTPAVGSFIDPVEIQLNSELLGLYRAEIACPMDYGTITSRVLGAVSDVTYSSAADFLHDVKLVTSNCVQYWGRRTAEGGADYIADARALQKAVEGRMQSAQHEGPPLMPTLPVVVAVTQIAPPPVHAHAPVSVHSNAPRSSLSSSNLSLGTTINLKRQAPKGGGGGGAIVKPEAIVDAFPIGSGAESAIPYLPTSLETSNFYLLPSESKHESANQVERRAQKYFNTMVLGLLEDELQRHYLKTANGTRIPTCNPFISKVDTRIFPEYEVFLKSERRDEVYIQLMARKVRSGQYGTSLVAVIRDMQRLRDNAHAFNVGAENIETRIMADCVANYFSYLTKQCLIALMNSADSNLKHYLLTAETLPLLDVPSAPDVLNFLKVQHEDRLEEHRRQQEEQARKRMPAPQSPIRPPAADNAYYADGPDGMYLDGGDGGAAGGGGDIFDAVDMAIFDFDLDLSNSMPLTPTYDGFGGGPIKGPGKGKGSLGGGAGAYAMPPHVKTEWEIAATTVLNKICRHPMVDSRASTTAAKSLLIADFFRPVVSAEYLQVVTQPMNLTLLGSELDQGLLLDSEDFLEKLTRVFQNLVKYNEREGIPEVQKQASQEMVIKGSHLVRYVKWLCLEHLPCKAADVEARHDKPELLGELRASVQSAERKVREELLFPAPIPANPLDLKRLLGYLKKTKNKTDAIRMGWFCEPPVQPSDYAVYVRRPMDLGTISSRLDHSGYRTFGEVLGDMRLVFQNSIKYNSVHMNLDDGSKTVHTAATLFLQKFESLMPTFTLEAAEKVERDRIVNINFHRLEMENYQRHLQEQQQLALFQEQEKRRRLEQDAAFRADQDVELKKQRTLAEQKDYEIVQQRLRGEMQERADEAAYDDGTGSGPMAISSLSAEAQAEQMLLLERRATMRLQGLGPSGVAPAQLLPAVETIAAVRMAAWTAWECVAVRGNQPQAQTQTQKLGVGGFMANARESASSSPSGAPESLTLVPESAVSPQEERPPMQQDPPREPEQRAPEARCGGWVQKKRPFAATERSGDSVGVVFEALRVAPVPLPTLAGTRRFNTLFGF